MFKKLPLASAVAFAIAMPAANAADFDIGPLNVQIDSTFSLGAVWRVGSRDTRVLHPSNFDGGLGLSGVADDGNLNFDRGDLTSFVFRGIHDIAIDGGSYGAFVRFNYWYDDVLENANVNHGHTANNYIPNTRLNTDAFDPYARGSGVKLLDAFVYSSFDLGNMPADLRVGRQVLSWGESTFIVNGINAINPADVNALRRPGAELREALLPVGMVSFSVGLTENLSLDTFVQYEWDNTKIDGCGTYFSAVDILGGPGCNKVTLNPEVGPGFALSDRESVEAGLYVLRAEDVEASDSGQFGVSLRYYSQAADTEFGFYYLNVHNTAPFISAYDWRTNEFSNNVVSTLGPQYFVEWPEDNKIYGVSFSTTLGTWSWSGEVSYRPNQAVQINTTEILTAGLQPTIPSSFAGRIVEARPDGLAVGNRAAGYDELEVWQAQTTFVQFFDRLWGSDRMTFIAEVGMNHVADLPSLDVQRYGRSPVYGKCFTQADSTATGGAVPVGNCEGFVTSTSWGYRTRFVFDFANAFMGWNLNPTLVFGHDVSGYSPNTNFIEGRRNLGFLLDASYTSRYRLSLAYNRFDGARYDPAQDRDFVSANFSIAF
ncbi:MAG: DUF1302 domain-containing protein [Idiomarina sp.]|nr:DUF1302 domain-containing protein [Idiomarina sp.]